MMDIYQALNIGEFFKVDDLQEKDIHCWLLYQTDEEKGRRKTVITVGPQQASIRNVVPETMCYILYVEDEYYKKISLDVFAETDNINFVEILLKEGIKINICEVDLNKAIMEGLSIKIYPCIRCGRKDISEIIAHDTNGFCVFHPMKARDVEVYYSPNVKKLNKAFLNEIICIIGLNEKNLIINNTSEKH